MNTLEELPERCNHPMECLELIATKTYRAPSTTPVFSTSHAIIRCHKCGKSMHMISDYGDWHKDYDSNVEIIPRCTGYL